MQGTVIFFVIRTFDSNNIVLYCNFHIRVKRTGKFAFRAFNGNHLAIEGCCYACRDINRHSTYSGHIDTSKTIYQT